MPFHNTDRRQAKPVLSIKPSHFGLALAAALFLWLVIIVLMWVAFQPANEALTRATVLSGYQQFSNQISPPRVCTVPLIAGIKTISDVLK
jgi:hypothetical protein